jgi:hypothetical protein
LRALRDFDGVIDGLDENLSFVTLDFVRAFDLALILAFEGEVARHRHDLFSGLIGAFRLAHEMYSVDAPLPPSFRKADSGYE